MRLILNSSFYFRVSLCETRLFYYLRCNKLLNADAPVILKSADFCDDVFLECLKSVQNRGRNLRYRCAEFPISFFDSCALTFRLLLELHQNDSNKFDFIFIRGANPVQ